MHRRTTIGQGTLVHDKPLDLTTRSPCPLGWLIGTQIQRTVFGLRVFFSNYLPSPAPSVIAHLVQAGSQSLTFPAFPPYLGRRFSISTINFHPNLLVLSAVVWAPPPVLFPLPGTLPAAVPPSPFSGKLPQVNHHFTSPHSPARLPASPFYHTSRLFV